MKEGKLHKWAVAWKTSIGTVFGDSWRLAHQFFLAGLPFFCPLRWRLLRTATSGATGSVSLSPSLVWSLLAGVLVGVVLLIFQMRAEYRRRTFDPTWVLRLNDTFNGKEMKTVRSRAAEALKKNAGGLQRSDFASADVDELLDFFEDLGFYMQGDQITPEVAHHAFHHWIRGYYSATRDYVDVARETEPSRWEFVNVLFDTTNEIEAERTKGGYRKFVDGADLEYFLDTEIDLVPRHQA